MTTGTETGTRTRARRRRRRGRRRPLVTAALAVVAAVAIAAGVVAYNDASTPSGPLTSLPPSARSYLGVYTPDLPASYGGVSAFRQATGTTPDIVMYYSGWYVPFPATFAAKVADEGAAPLVQMEPTGIDVAKIAAGHYDGYLSAYAEAVRAYRHPVILSFGHEMNGTWYSWANTHTSPAVFVQAWRHIFGLFRALGAGNVTWLWTVNIINNTKTGTIPSPRAWWPGAAYVNWVGVDGYYLKPNWQFAPLFGPTIGAVRQFTSAPILISETGAEPAANQAAKVADLFAGIKSYGLLGMVYFDSTNSTGQKFGLSGPAAIDAFRQGARLYHRPGA
ncbi:MAG TPA: glycosyl hydrolase [Streptosporangiaceae bacterium]